MNENYSYPNSHKETMESPFTDTVYYVSSDEDDTVLVGMNIQLTNGRIQWFDTIKDRTMPITDITTEDGVIRVTVTEENQPSKTYRFAPMTLDTYNTYVKEKLLDGKAFEDESELHEAFRNTRETAW